MSNPEMMDADGPPGPRMPRQRLAVLLTCYNRREGALRCLAALEKQRALPHVLVDVYLVDDGSSDGTAEAVRQAFPKVRILPGNGALFWNGGMRLAWETAREKDYDFYAWLNDDTELYPDAVARLLQVAYDVKQRMGLDEIVVGSTRDPQSERLTYGGVVRARGFLRFGFQLVQPGERPLPCDTMNGNCVLIPRGIVQDVGILSADFTHSTGDFDYGLRAGQQGYTSWIAPGYIGTCRRNSPEGAWYDPRLPFSERLRRRRAPKGLPLREYLLFVQRHGGRVRAGWALLKAQLKLLFPRAYGTLKRLQGGDEPVRPRRQIADS